MERRRGLAMDRLFGLRAAGTTAGREVVAGLVTFATLSYILFVQPVVLGSPPSGMDPAGVLFATCVASGIACLVMGFVARYPIALAPAMGHNFFFVFGVCAARGFSWQEALAANLVAGVLFLVLAGTGVRRRVLEALPGSLVAAIGAGIGLLIALVGLQWGGLVQDSPATLVQLGDLGAPVALLALFGLALNALLLVRRVRGALLIGLVGTAAAGLAASAVLGLEPALVSWHGLVGAPPSPAGTAFQLDFGGLFARPLTDWLAVVLVFIVLDLFDTVGTLVGLARQGGLLKDGQLPRAERAFAADAVGTSVGALLGTSTVTSYVESAAGISAGGRTGLTAVTVAGCFFGALFFTPLVQTIGGGVVLADGAVLYPVIAPVLVLIGALMMGSVRDVDWRDPAVAIPAFLTMMMMPLSFSITEGIAWGVISSSALALATGRAREHSALLHAFALFFVLRYVFL